MDNNLFIPRSELELRWNKLRQKWQELKFDSEGIFIFSRPIIYYFTGTWANGLLFCPYEGEPVLMCRRGVERAKQESSLKNICYFYSFSELEGILKDYGYKLSNPIGVNQKGLSWDLANLFQTKLKDKQFISADNLLALTRAVKTEYELYYLKEAGARHNKGLTQLLPEQIYPGLSEYEIAVKVWEVFFSLEHCGMMRMQACGEEIFLGHIAAGDSGVYGSAFNGPLCLRGVHPLVPHMGSPNKIWQKNEPLSIDVGFGYKGYHTDKTQVYFSKDYTPDKKFLDAQKCCQDIQELARQMLRPGVLPEEIYFNAIEFAKKAGFEQGFMGLQENKVRFVGHGIGLFIDEFPALAAKVKIPLEKNMVIALEPKIGFPHWGMIGVENTFVVTEQGGICLTGENFDPIYV
ncbi:MAG: Xaa-Pro peptidase family protein [Desulfonauticus sp.]|nr:Xaa-Pro peptidase family protein [Desulfonauticus sp.]